MKTCPPEKKKTNVEVYKKNSKEAHEQYVWAYKKHCQLKQQISRLEHNHQFDAAKKEWKALDGAASQELDKLHISCVIAAKTATPDLDFGSLDDNYADLQEHCLDFDPTVDTIPDTDQN